MKNYIVLLLGVWGGLFTSADVYGQSEKFNKTIPLHIEASLGAGTACKNIMPIDVNIDLNYTFAKKFSLHATTQTSYFVPKDGITTNYNRATNLGGGLGYVFLPQKNDNLGDFELRASVTTSVGSSDLRTPHTN